MVAITKFLDTVNCLLAVFPCSFMNSRILLIESICSCDKSLIEIILSKFTLGDTLLNRLFKKLISGIIPIRLIFKANVVCEFDFICYPSPLYAINKMGLFVVTNKILLDDSRSKKVSEANQTFLRHDEVLRTTVSIRLVR